MEIIRPSRQMEGLMKNNTERMINLPQLTPRQQALLNLLNQLSQNLASLNISEEGISNDFNLTLPGGFNFTSGLNLPFPNLGGSNGGGPAPGDPDPTPPQAPGQPSTIVEALQNLLNEQVELTTPFGPVTGTLISVLDDYVVLAEADGSRTLVRTDKVELVRDL